MRRLLLAFGMLAVLAASACSSTEPTTSTSSAQKPSTTAADAAVSTTSSASAALRVSYDPNRNAARDITQALRASAADGHPVLLDFGADWCPDCVVIGRLYRTPAITKILAEHYHLVLVDVGEYNRNLGLAARYVHLKTSGIPALVLLRPNGRIAYASNNGAFRNARTMKADQLSAFLTKWSTTR